MREVIFSRQNNKRWKETEEVFRNKKKIDPDLLAKYYVQLTDDLAYAQTYYPNSNTTSYLNNLAQLAHGELQAKRRHSWGSISNFWINEYPRIIGRNYRFVTIALVVFFLSCLVGAYSAANDQTFVNLIMGDTYVSKTMENIENGNALGVYEKSSEFPMFIYITLNNIRVALLAFAFGVLATVGTGFLLLQNGIMLGSFQYFFHSKNLLLLSASGIWMHGTIEIFSIVIAGAAGIRMGHGILFPGTYSRLTALQKGAMEGVKIVTGLIPFFIIAGFIESYLTRHYELGWLSFTVILLSVILLIIYFFVYPLILRHKDASRN